MSLDILITYGLMGLVALAFPSMLYNIWAGHQERQGIDVPTLGDWVREGWAYVAEAWAAVAPYLAVLLYFIKRQIAYEWEPTEDEKPALLRRAPPDTDPDYVEQGPAQALSDADGRRTDRVSALIRAMEAQELDETRAALIELAVLTDWPVGLTRALVKGSNDAVGAEVEAARRRLGITTPSRTITVREHANGQATERQITL